METLVGSGVREGRPEKDRNFTWVPVLQADESLCYIESIWDGAGGRGERRGEIWCWKRRKEHKNCCVYTQQLKWLHKHDPLSFSIFIHPFPLPHHLADSAKANQIEVLSSALAGVTEWKKPDRLQPPGLECHSLHYMVAISRSKALQLPYYRSDCGGRLLINWGCQICLCLRDWKFAQRFCWFRSFGIWHRVCGVVSPEVSNDEAEILDPFYT